MMRGARRVLLLALDLAIVGAGALLWNGIRILRSDETTGLDHVGIAPAAPSTPMPVGKSHQEFHAWWYAASLVEFGEPPLGKLAEKAGGEAYRFCYQPSFHDNVCVTVWRDRDHCWMRRSVLHWDRDTEVRHLWTKTRSISAGNLDRLHSLFRKPSVINPLNGEEQPAGIDGSSWILESAVSGATTFTEVDNPVRSIQLLLLQIIKPREARMKDFVSTCRLLLDWGEVRIPVIY